jgi:anti-sigma regulatory factor (Ser/Thr protein kinase)
MLIHQQNMVPISDNSSIGEARRISSRMAERARMQGYELGRVPLIVTELATNLLLHTSGGELIVRMLPVEMGPGIEIISLDRGPGIADIKLCMKDGYSTSGTRGCGLGAVQRLSTEFDIYSTQPAGTVVVSRVLSKGFQPHRLEYSAISVPVSGETECGDTWDLRLVEHKFAAIVVDGLGHGPLAARAAAEALSVFGGGRFDTPVDYFEAAHSSLNTTRGAAIALAQVDLNQRRLQYAGVGNISGIIVSGGEAKNQSLISHNGIVGTAVRKLQQFDYLWQDGDLLIMHSDGLGVRWKLTDYAGLIRADPAVIAAVLYRDAKRGRDDATVLVSRLKASQL